jgi:hypothetical protein
VKGFESFAPNGVKGFESFAPNGVRWWILVIHQPK